MAKARVAPSPADQRNTEALGLLGMIVASLPPQGRAFIRSSVTVTAAAAIKEEPDRAVILAMVARAFDAIEGCDLAGDREPA